jgi:hypothetical protein
VRRSQVWLVLCRGRRDGLVEQDQVVDELDAGPMCARLRVLRTGGMEPTGHIHAAALVQVLRGNLGKDRPRTAARPLGLGLHLAVRVGPAAVGRHAERRTSSVLFTLVSQRCFHIVAAAPDCIASKGLTTSYDVDTSISDDGRKHYTLSPAGFCRALQPG